ncbi:extracellular solute-binding protein [Dactylosporangium sp. NBC_01737]|uniref:ABC transporter substrate-binding protein n=1 Tax=Dactylosporangium sp. NBC_01737 TaxID=2975959 RepID=UPI002E14CC08|nr:extracellular solute-binding protein [Dactylosporangium sp. NBC_01737]
MKNRIVGAAAAATVLALSITACSAPSVDDSRDDAGALVIYSAEEVVDFFAKRFENDRSGVSVEVVKGSSGESVSRVIAEKDNPRGDIVIAGNDPASSNPGVFAKNEGVDLSGINPALIDDAGYAVPVVVFPVIFVYNEDRLKGDAVPTKWAELADAKWKKRVYMGNPITSEAAYKAMATWWAIGGWDLVKAIAQNVIVTEGSTDPMRAVGNGEAAIGIGVEQQVYKWADGKKTKAGYPTDGIILHVQTWYKVAHSPSPTNATSFLNFMLTPENQKLMTKEYPGMRSVLTDEPVSDAVPPLSRLNIIDLPEEAMKDRKAWNDRWKDIITSVG